MYFKIEEAPKVTLKVTPDFNVSNKDNIVIANLLSSLYKSPAKRLHVNIQRKQIVYRKNHNIFFDILLEPNRAEFYITIPADYKEMFISKIQSVWKGTALEEVSEKEIRETLSNFSYGTTHLGKLGLKDYNFRSLTTDKGNTYPLSNTLATTRQLQEGDKVRVNFNIEPLKRRNWISLSKDEREKFNRVGSIDKTKTNTESVFEFAIKTLQTLIEAYIGLKLLAFESILGILATNDSPSSKPDHPTTRNLTRPSERDTTRDTVYKMTSEAFYIDITLLSQSSDTDRRENNMISVANSYKDLTGDNEMVLHEIPDNFIKRKYRRGTFDTVIGFKNTGVNFNKNIYSDKELAKFIQLPQKTLQHEYKISNIDTRELKLPKDLTKKGIRIGEASYKGKTTQAYWCGDYNSMAMPKVVGGSMGAGKSTLTENFIIDANKQGHSVIVFDYIKNCELTQNSSKHTTNNIIIDLSNIDELPAFCYPELSKTLETATNFEKMEIASDVGQQIKYLINSITDDDTGKLTRAMVKYLTSSARVVFIHPNKSLSDCIRVLEDWEVRNEYIRKARDVYGKESRIFNTLNELNKRDKDGKIIGTNTNLLEGVFNRVDILEESPRLQLMLQAKNDKHDFEDYMNQGKAVYLKLPQSDFKDPETVDIIVTYFMTRIRLASIGRSKIDKPNICHIITDEVGQVPTTASFFANHITEFRKFGLAPYFTMHYLGQFRSLLNAIKSAGTSYMLLAGLEKENIFALSEEISPFTVEEFMELKPFHSLNIIRHKNKRSSFISKLPKQVNI